MKYFGLVLVLFGISGSTYAQDTVRIDLLGAIYRGISISVDAKVAENTFTAAYWDYRTFKTELLPEVVLTGTVPYYSNSYNIHQNSDGSYTYVGNNYNTINGGLSVTQNIPWTGGKVIVESDFERLHQSGNNSTNRYHSIPVGVTLEQPIFGFNRVRWLQKIEPVKYKEAKQKLLSDKEDVALTVIEYYFNLLLGQVNLESAIQNRDNAEKLFKISEARNYIGQLSDVELLQMKSALLSAEATLTNAWASVNARMLQLRSFLGYEETVSLLPVFPDVITSDLPTLNYYEVLSLALDNSSFTQNIQKRILEASREVSQAKADRWDISLFASFGWASQESSFRKSMMTSNWRDNQLINIGLRIPILDWGKSKGKVRVAESNLEVVNSKIEKERMDFDQNVFLCVQNFNDQPRQLQLAKEVDAMA